jgi:hypothetical protein
MPDTKNFDAIFARLKVIFQPYAKQMDVAQDSPAYYLLNTRHIMKNKQPLCFGGVRAPGESVCQFLSHVGLRLPGFIAGHVAGIKEAHAG